MANYVKNIMTICVIFALCSSQSAYSGNDPVDRNNFKDSVSVDFNKPFIISEVKNGNSSNLNCTITFTRDMLVEIKNGMEIYKINMIIESKSGNISTLRIGPLGVTNETNNLYSGNIWIGPVHIVNGPFGPQELFLEGSEKPDTTVTLKPAEEITLYLRVPFPRGEKTVEFQISLGDKYIKSIIAKM